MDGDGVECILWHVKGGGGCKNTEWYVYCVCVERVVEITGKLVTGHHLTSAGKHYPIIILPVFILESSYYWISFASLYCYC